MMSYLGHYPGARSKPVPKFNRAIQSFVNQTLKDCELIIVSDGCELTNQEYEANWSNHDNITLIKPEKSKDKWPGVKRQLAREIAKGEWIIYLDADDVYTSDYLEKVASHIDDKHSVMLNTSPTMGDERITLKRNIEIKGLYPPVSYSRASLFMPGTRIENMYNNAKIYGLGTASIIHKNSVSCEWKNSDKRGEDANFCMDLANTHPYKMISVIGYVICHDPKFKRNPWDKHLDI